MARRQRRNGGQWKVLAPEPLRGPMWYVAAGVTVPAGSLEEGLSVATALVRFEARDAAYVMAPSGIFAAAVVKRDEHLGAQADVAAYDVFVARAYGITLNALALEVEAGRSVCAMSDVIKARDAAEREWRSARRASRVPSPPSGWYPFVISSATMLALDHSRSHGFAAVGWVERVHIGREGAHPGERELVAFNVVTPRSGKMLLASEQTHGEGRPLVIVDADATSLWTNMSRNAFRDMQFSEGFE